MNDWCSCNPLKEAQEKAAKWDAIVRCGECKHCSEEGVYTPAYYCLRHSPLCGVPTDPSGFCAWGERQDA